MPNIQRFESFYNEERGKKGRRPAAPQKYECTRSKSPFRVLCNIHAAQANELIEFWPLLKTVCRNSCVQLLFVCLFIYLTSAYGKHSCWSHLHDGNPRTPVHCRGERAAAFTPEQGTTVKCCWAAAVYWTLNCSDMPFWCSESLVRNCKVLHACIFGYLNVNELYWEDLACSMKGWKKMLRACCSLEFGLFDVFGCKAAFGVDKCIIALFQLFMLCFLCYRGIFLLGNNRPKDSSVHPALWVTPTT